MNKGLLFYSGNGNHSLGAKVVDRFSENVGQKYNFNQIDFGQFPDGESDFRIPNFLIIKGKTVVFYQSIFNHELFEEALELIWSLKKQYQASRLIAVIPFMIFRRQDHEEKSEEICRLKMGLDRLRHAGVDEIITVAPHSEKLVKFGLDLGLNIHVIDPSPLFASVVKSSLSIDSTKEKIKVYAPDKGSIPRAVALAQKINSSVIFSLKKRGLNNEIEIEPGEESDISKIISKYNSEGFLEIYHVNKENIKESYIIMIEDEISTGTTANKVGCFLKSLGAKKIVFLASHAVLSPGWRRKLINNNPFDKIILGDTIPRDYEKRTGGLIQDISFADLIAQALSQSLNNLI